MDSRQYARSWELVDLLVGSEGTLAFFVELELDLTPVARRDEQRARRVRVARASGRGGRAERVRRARSRASCSIARSSTSRHRAARRGTFRRTRSPRCSLKSKATMRTRRQRSGARDRGDFSRRRRDDGSRRARPADRDASSGSCVTRRVRFSLGSIRICARCSSSRTARCRRSSLPAYVRGVREILAANDTRGVIFGHAGDAHVHVNPLVDVGRDDWRERVDADSRRRDVARRDARRNAGGRAWRRTAAHAAHARACGRRDALERFRAVKTRVRSAGIFNPGVKVALPGERALGAIKYDPALAPLASAARVGARSRGARARVRSRFVSICSRRRTGE